MAVLRITKKFWNILTKHQRLKIVCLFVLMIIGGFMEMLSVSLMIPFMSTVMKPDDMLAKTYIQQIMVLLNLRDYQSLLVFLSLIMAFIYVIKNIYLLFQLMIQEKFVQNYSFLTQKELMRCFLNKPYEFFLSAQSGEIIRIISNDTNNAFKALKTLISLYSELIVSGILMITIFCIAPVLTLSLTAILLVATFLLFFFTKKRLRKSGEKCNESRTGMNQTLLQSIQGIKEIKLMRKDKYFLNLFSKDGLIYVRTLYIGQTLSQMPRFLLEASAMSGFFMILASLINSGYDLEALFPMIAGVAVASVRLLPSMNRISSALANAAYYEPSVDKMIENLNTYTFSDDCCTDNDLIIDDKKTISGFSNEIVMNDVAYKYPTGSNEILHHADMVIRKGDAVGIIGTSGAGKTTAVDILLGLLKPQSGKVQIDEVNIAMDMEGWLSQIGYIPQTIFMLDGSIRENVAFGIDAENIDDAKVWKVIKESALEEYVKALPDGLDTQIGERGIRLSGGQRQRIGIARALYTDPEILFFDEATSALDNDTEKAIMDSIEHLQGNKTLIIIAHRLSTIEKCNVIYRVNNGVIVREN